MKNAYRTPRTRRQRVANVFFVAADALLVLGVLAGIWWWYLNRVPALNTPATPPPPNPNGYDRLAAAGKQVAREKEVGFAIGTPEAQQKELGRVISPEEREQIIAENAETLAAVREALTLPVQAPSFKTFDQTFPEFAKIRGLARLLFLEEKVHEAKGEIGAAAGSSLDAMQMGAAIPNGGPLIARLVGIACEAIGRRPLVPLVDKMSAPEARSAATRLETILASRTPLTKTLEAEKWGTQSGLRDAFSKDNVVRTALAIAQPVGEGDGQSQSPMEKVGIGLAALRTPKAQVLANSARYMDAVIAQMEQPYDPHPPMPAAPSDLISRLLTPTFTQARHKETDTQAQNALLLGKLALRAYHEEHGDYPRSLSELVSTGYLKAIPTDPFARDGQDTLRYLRVSAAEYVLYSVGPDGVDNSGKPIENRRDDGTMKRWTEPDSKGDFVLGVNLY